MDAETYRGPMHAVFDISVNVRENTMNEFRYEIGDIVIINDNVNYFNLIECNPRFVIDLADYYETAKGIKPGMTKYVGKIARIVDVDNDNFTGYKLDVDNRYYTWHQDMLTQLKDNNNDYYETPRL